MDMQFLTRDGHQQALGQLEFLRTVKRAEIARRLREAQEAGGPSGDAVYEDVKREQVRLERRVLELERLLAAATLIEKGPAEEVSLGSVVFLETGDNVEHQYTIVGSYEANAGAGFISNESPVGRALLGHRAGDRVLVAAPGGVKTYTIIRLE
jgi:transcription elongation factor GreA